jgi:hypothetical protein
MTTKKQIIANQTNALASTGPKTAKGKVTVAANPIKHGIFVASPLYGENASDYQELLQNLKNSLVPQNQMESLLVEKIAIDFWRLRRVICFESGSIEQCLETLFREFYTYGRKTSPELAKQIEYHRDEILWIESYIECLQKNEVTFDHPSWEGQVISSDIADDFYLLAQNLPSLSYQEKEALPYKDFVKLKAILERHGFTSKAPIGESLIELYLKEKQKVMNEVEALKKKQLDNAAADNLHRMLGCLPNADNVDNVDKVLKYERSLQKSICENLFLLKKLQGLF